ncbi:MAG: hypothetical protein HKN25_02435 [Pyrinomonadaceae bacterium]|nr:hypothetical protein [Pyrinomonadaceae bacterium]
MENEKLKMEDAGSGSRRKTSTIDYPFGEQNTCPACGSIAVRKDANYCLVCGKILSEDYEPLDAMRSSHHLQGKSFLVENSETEEITDLFQRSENNVAETAWACFVYSMVPYLGILFIPFTFIFGAAGIAFAYRYPRTGGGKLAMASIGLSFLILLLQIFFWWLLYIIPVLTGQI